MTSAADEIIDLYSRHADAWAELRGGTLNSVESAHMERFVAALPPGGEILDLGCGSGRPIAAWLIDRGFRVTGVDASPGLVNLCRAAFPAHDWRLADMRGLDLGRRFDGVLAWFSSFHLPAEDQEGMAAVYARHTRRGGRVMFMGGPEHGVAMGRWMDRPLHHASLAPAEYRAGLEATGFVEIVEQPLDDDARIWTARRDLSD